MTGCPPPLRRLPHATLDADRARTIRRFFVPGREDVGPGDSRAGAVVDRILALDDEEVSCAASDLARRFPDSIDVLRSDFARHAALIESRLDPDVDLGVDRRLLLGAAFTHEYATEGASLCNPSAVLISDEADGSARFMMSVRGIGEGHISSLSFVNGSLDAQGVTSLEPRAKHGTLGSVAGGLHRRSVLHLALAAHGDDQENAAQLLGHLPSTFEDVAIERRLRSLSQDAATRRHTDQTEVNVRALMDRAYTVSFMAETQASERVLWPVSRAESHGIEDARFVRFVDDDGDVSFYATYTAFDGLDVSQQLMHTKDFLTFSVSPMAGEAAQGKGLALFPRRIGGCFAALSRSDRETNSIAFSDDIRCWPTSVPLQRPERVWESVQLGNCGSPIETERGWLVLTHGVGPLRTYSIGAILLDLEDPCRLVARSDQPIIEPDPRSRGGYVPNVVYSCGGFVHGDTLVVPYGVNDQSIAVVTMPVAELLDSLTPTSA